MIDKFYCYSKRLCLFLKCMNETYLGIGISQKTGVKYWIFQKSERLDKLISLWNEIKHN